VCRPGARGAKGDAILSTKRTQITVFLSLSQLAFLGLACELRAQNPADSSAATPSQAGVVQKPITREDAELMLREAHGHIEQGRFDEAEKIISRVEKANVQFPYFHVGPTPAALRRELVHAQRLRAATKSLSHDQPTGASRFLPFSRSTSQSSQTTDPFANRNSTNDRSTTTTSRNLGAVSAPNMGQPQYKPSEASSSHAGPSNNPFASAGNTAGLKLPTTNSEPASSPTSLAYPTTQTSGNDSSMGGDQKSLSAAADPSLGNSPNSSWALPSAPLPRGASDRQFSNGDPGLLPPRRSASDSANETRPSAVNSKQKAQENLSAARKALASGDIDLAEKLTHAANALGVPESQYLPDEDRPSLVAWDIAKAKQNTNSSRPGVSRLPAPASHYDEPSARMAERTSAIEQHSSNPRQADYRTDDRSPRPSPYRQTPQPSPANNQIAQAAPPITPIGAGEERYLQSSPSAQQLDARGADGPQILAALPASASEKLPNAPVTAAPAQEEVPVPPPAPLPSAESNNDSAAQAPNSNAPADINPYAPTSKQQSAKQPAATRRPKSMIDSADEAQQVVMRKLYAEVSKRQSEAIKLREKDSERALATLREAQKLVNESKLPESTRRELLSRIDKTIHDTQDYAKSHSVQIDLDKRNENVKSSIDHDRDMKVKLQQTIADQVNEYNKLVHERRLAEAEIVARRLHELSPDNPVVAQIWQESKFLRREIMNHELVDNKEDSVWRQFNAVEESALNPVADNGKELVFDQRKWEGFVKNRKGSKDRTEHRSEREIEIERRLQTPVLLKYQETPLTEVMNGLSELTGVNIHLDPRGLSQEGVNTDTPVTINLSKEISLKSALNLILGPLHLTYVVTDEVLKITSEQLRDGELKTKTYNVADLVTPIPNFVPNSNIGLQGLINESMAAGRGAFNNIGNGSPTVLVNDRGGRTAAGPNGKVLAQQLGSTPTPGLNNPTQQIGAGPGGMGGAANADFDSLIDLIVSTIATDTWAENGGGQAEVRPFPTNLSLVISQTQAVHEQIADLLQQLRRLQDLQVTIEVRFIRLNDTFFERIGIDFQLNVKDHGVDTTNTTNNPFQPLGGPLSNTVGINRPVTGGAPFPNFTSDLDIPFRQNSFDLTQIAPFTGPVGGGLNFGFAILSDIEAFFLIEAAQGDSRTNVLQAPKVTLFNGQQAFVADATQRPFVVGVIPVVGEFAAASQPVIVVLNEGTMMTIQAVVSDDRRYVRLTIVPFFTQIGNVDTFTFEGSSSSTSSSSTTDNNNDGKTEKKDDSKGNSSTGVTVQLPSLSFISVVTTVSVPDGGTVLLGGIKRLSEGRTEFGVPLLSKIPYINRLFRNVVVGRNTDSLMMMVTPRIIIQEEEEERLGIATPTPP
jgi:type II secretory pathway component GspD/PulD (secretin)